MSRRGIRRVPSDRQIFLGATRRQDLLQFLAETSGERLPEAYLTHAAFFLDHARVSTTEDEEGIQLSAQILEAKKLVVSILAESEKRTRGAL